MSPGKKGKSGGARKGAGRPATGRTKRKVQFYLSYHVIALIETFSEGKPSEFVSKAIEYYLKKGFTKIKS